MILGDPSRLGIQWEISDFKSGFFFGRFCFIANNSGIGDYDEAVSISVTVAGVSGLLKNAGRRAVPALLDKPPHEAFDVIFQKLYADYGRADDEIASDEAIFSKLNVSGYVDALDKWYCFLMESTEFARLLFCPKANLGRLTEVKLVPGEFDTVCNSFVIAAEEQMSVQQLGSDP